ncbi:ABC transporter permease [Ectobacillus ponti]|uniref:ABC transporter permease n=1 Tax=Ectobacillus ponti TaxID=2961894 RepID=A0AA42BQQ1_9BACI|nr:ABC transporter permease subunit [Ectobacillus ponti]MCP8969626.1 ABC transporter permease [Ectobacillus ponti]
MSRWLRLVYNELLKIMKRRGFIAPLVLLYLPVLVLGNWDYLEYQQQLKAGDWRQQVQEDIAHKRYEIQGAADSATVQVLQEQIAVGEYELQYNIPPYSAHSVTGFMNSSSALIPLIGMFLIFYASSMVSKEHSLGTMNFLLVRPPSRMGILGAKFASLAVLYMLFSVVLLFYSFIQGLFLYGRTAMTAVVLHVSGGTVQAESMLGATLKVYVLDALPLLLFAALAFSMSAVLRSSGPALIVTVLLFAAKGLIADQLSRFSWSKYIFFAHTNLSWNPNIFSVFVLLSYLALFLGAALFVFQRRDVT